MCFVVPETVDECTASALVVECKRQSWALLLCFGRPSWGHRATSPSSVPLCGISKTGVFDQFQAKMDATASSMEDNTQSCALDTPFRHAF